MKKYIRPEMTVLECMADGNSFFCTSPDGTAVCDDKYADENLEMLSNRNLWELDLFENAR